MSFMMGDEDEASGLATMGMSTVGKHRPARGHRPAPKQRVSTPKWMNATTSQGVSRPQEELDFLPFDLVAITNDDAGALSRVLTGAPQRPFRGERLIMIASDADGVDVSANIVIDPAIYVGAVQVGASQGSTPIGAFSANAFGVRLSMPAAGQGTLIKIFVRALTLPADVTSIAAVIIGRAMR